MDKEAAEHFRDSPLWQKAHRFVLAVYNFTDYFPAKEVYGLTSQFRRAAASIPVSISECLARETEEVHSVGAARRLIQECRYYLILAKDLGYGDNPELAPQLEEVSRMLEEYGARTLNF
jgi:four helix bundle protein